MSRIALLCLLFLSFTTAVGAESAPVEQFPPIRQVGVFVMPYYQAAQTLQGRPQVDVAQAFNMQLASNRREDVLAVRDAIEAQPQLITPMTLMVLAIRLYDVGLRDDAVFWFYVAKNRYLAMAGVLNVRTSALIQVEEAVRNFATLAGPFFNSYAFCDPAKQREASTKSIAWVEQHPYEAIFMPQLPALPGDRTENLKKSLADIRVRVQKEAQYLDDPKNQAEFKRRREENHVPEQFCWVQ